MRNVLSGLMVLGMCAAALHSAEAGTVYNNAADFSLASNPNGVWSYGYLAAGSSPVSSTFTSYASTATLGSSIEVWNVSGGGLNPPEDFYNDTSSVVSYLSITMQPYQAAFHPGPDGEYSVYRFTAPVAGSYSLSAIFTGIDSASTVVYVLDNGTSLFQGDINGYLSTSSYSTTLNLSTGEIIDFAVGLGSHYNNDSTALDATMTLNAASVPEPSGWILLSLGLGGLSLFRFRPRRALVTT